MSEGRDLSERANRIRANLGRAGLPALAAVGLVAIVFGLWIAFSPWDRQEARLPGDSQEARLPGPPGVLVTLPSPKPVPLSTFSGPDGGTTSLQAFRGRLVVVNLWATWCPPCIREMPSLDRLRQATAGSGIEVVAVSEDGEPGLAKTFLDQRRLGLAPYHDPGGRLLRGLGASGLPTTFVISPDGRVVARLEGEAAWDSAAMITALEAFRSPTAGH